MVEACSYRVRAGALSGRGAVWAGFPGLKPRAESYSPFGAPNLPNIPQVSAIQPWASGKLADTTYSNWTVAL
jgi:hypothetical protein